MARPGLGAGVSRKCFPVQAAGSENHYLLDYDNGYYYNRSLF